ncbi:putative glycerophosphocholine phosphodiesterase GPCPD1 -like protein T05H10.7 [Trichinella pseudospiralis]|uniref:Putative glycerophosphocholine phosphodiesterase GPCPD1-like protein T05H10.7 n=1 Tax=Trichinella pseudospiralis TaxID=6337 RepID=A0A0V1K139_TRIPS|nr:putative glycerophosphocholine phosphodiesterase GPCPD1 -like protein T05H10.7 [Trichinella pseudospiralis]
MPVKLVDVTFILKSLLPGYELAFISGSHELLGKWKPSFALPMVKDTTEIDKWYIRIKLPVGEKIQYRFFSAFFDPYISRENPRYFLSRWEGFLRPREILLSDMSESKIILCEFGAFENQLSLSNGWLTLQHEVLLTIDFSLISFVNPEKMENLHLKVTAFRTDTRSREFNDKEFNYESLQEYSWPSWCSRFTYHDCAFKENCSEMIPVESPDIWIFKAQFFTEDESMFKLDFFSISDEEGSARAIEEIGSAIVLTSATKSNPGLVKLPIWDKRNKVVAAIYVELLIIKPRKGEMGTLEHGSGAVWQKLNRPLNIGHRGVGRSFKKPCTLLENTIASFRAAARSGADFVEFDIQSTKDLFPVIYHNSDVKIWAKKRQPHGVSNSNDDNDLKEQKIAISELTKSELDALIMVDEQNFGIASDDQGNLIRLIENGELAGDSLPFPTLDEVLKHRSLPTELGFMIEVKYPQKLVYGYNNENYPERNIYVDAIVNSVLENAGQRKIIFSSFDPDICLMLKMKQSRYPVLFLTQGVNGPYDIYVGWRVQESDAAIRFAFVHGLAGVAFHSEKLLSNIASFHYASRLNLAAFVWGDDLDEFRHRTYFRDLHFDGLIYDRIDCHGLGLRKSSLFQQLHIKSYNSDGQRSTGGRSSDTNKLSFERLFTGKCINFPKSYTVRPDVEHTPRPSSESVTQIDLRYDNSRIGKANEPCQSRQF